MNPWSGTRLAPPPKRARAVCLLRRDIRRFARRFLPLHRPLPRCVRWQAAQTRLPLIKFEPQLCRRLLARWQTAPAWDAVRIVCRPIQEVTDG